MTTRSRKNTNQTKNSSESDERRLRRKMAMRTDNGADGETALHTYNRVVLELCLFNDISAVALALTSERGELHKLWEVGTVRKRLAKERDLWTASHRTNFHVISNFIKKHGKLGGHLNTLGKRLTCGSIIKAARGSAKSSQDKKLLHEHWTEDLLQEVRTFSLLLR